MLPNSLALLGASFDGPARSRAVGIWAAAGAIAAAIGPVLGGWLIDTVGWRAIFLINLPLAAAAIGLALYAIERDPPPTVGARLDFAGAALITGALLGLTWGLTEGAGAMGWRARPIAAMALGAGLAATYVWIERRLGDRALTPLALFGSRSLVALNLLTLLVYGAMAGFLLLLPFVLITAAGYSATAAGAVMLPFLHHDHRRRPCSASSPAASARDPADGRRDAAHRRPVAGCCGSGNVPITGRPSCPARTRPRAGHDLFRRTADIGDPRRGRRQTHRRRLGPQQRCGAAWRGRRDRSRRRGAGDARRCPDRRFPHCGHHRRRRLYGGRRDYRVSVSRRSYPGLGHSGRRRGCQPLRTTTT